MLFDFSQVIRQLTPSWHLQERRKEIHFLVWFLMPKFSLHSHYRNCHLHTLERYGGHNANMITIITWLKKPLLIRMLLTLHGEGVELRTLILELVEHSVQHVVMNVLIYLFFQILSILIDKHQDHIWASCRCSRILAEIPSRSWCQPGMNKNSC